MVGEDVLEERDVGLEKSERGGDQIVYDATRLAQRLWKAGASCALRATKTGSGQVGHSTNNGNRSRKQRSVCVHASLCHT